MDGKQSHLEFIAMDRLRTQWLLRYTFSLVRQDKFASFITNQMQPSQTFRDLW